MNSSQEEFKKKLKEKLKEKLAQSKECAIVSHNNLVKKIISNPWYESDRIWLSLVAKERKALAKYAQEFQLSIKLNGAK